MSLTYADEDVNLVLFSVGVSETSLGHFEDTLKEHVNLVMTQCFEVPWTGSWSSATHSPILRDNLVDEIRAAGQLSLHIFNAKLLKLASPLL